MSPGTRDWPGSPEDSGTQVLERGTQAREKCRRERGLRHGNALRTPVNKGTAPAPASSRKNSSLSLAECDFFISTMWLRGTFLLRDGEKKAGRLFRSGVGGVLKEVTWGRGAQSQSRLGRLLLAPLG